MRLYITGFPGSGKSTLAQTLSKNSGFGYEDLDENIEQSAGRSIREIFASDGEAAFRQMESTALRNAKEQIVSTGGGIVTLPENIAYMKTTGKILLLCAPFSVLCERLCASSNRPLVSGKEREDIKKLLFARAYAYNNADWCIDTGALSPEEVQEKAAACFRQITE